MNKLRDNTSVPMAQIGFINYIGKLVSGKLVSE